MCTHTYNVRIWLSCVPIQTLGKIYSILTDKDRRAIYDEEGTVDEGGSIFDQVVDHLMFLTYPAHGCAGARLDRLLEADVSQDYGGGHKVV